MHAKHTVPDALETPRLLMRRARSDDAAAVYYGWAQDEDVTKYLVWRPHRSFEEAVAHIQRCATAWLAGTTYTYFLEDRETGLVAGSIAMRPGAHGVNIGYLLARPYWGRGLMAEAVSAVAEWWLAQPGIFRVWATCDVDNRQSARVLEKSGFAREGTLRRWEYHPNVSAEPRDSLCYARVR